MKNWDLVIGGIALFFVMITVMSVSGCSDGPITTGSTNDLVDPDHFYEIDTWGSNSEVYEFTPRSDPSRSCVMLMLDSGAAMGLQCFPKPDPSGG